MSRKTFYLIAGLVAILLILFGTVIGRNDSRARPVPVVHYTRNSYLSRLQHVALKYGFSTEMVRFTAISSGENTRSALGSCATPTACDQLWVRFTQNPSDWSGGIDAGYDGEIIFSLQGTASGRGVQEVPGEQVSTHSIAATYSPSKSLCIEEIRGDEHYRGAASDESRTVVDIDSAPQISADGSWRWNFEVVRYEKVIESNGMTPIASGVVPAKYQGVCVGNTNSQRVSIRDVKLVSRHVVETTCVGAINSTACGETEVR